MKSPRWLLWLIPVFLVAGPSGCDDETCEPGDLSPPAAPRGLTTITGDGEVVLLWYPNEEWDLEGYRVYRNDRPSGNYDRIAWVHANRPAEYIDRAVRNGDTYHYAVSAVDFAGNESDLSPEAAYDTPRPEGSGLVLKSYDADPRRCACDFSRYASGMVTEYEDLDADIAYVFDEESGAWMFGLQDPPDSGPYTELQDAGYHERFDAVGWAPAYGWSPAAAVELIEGHIYVAWTRDDHYAKFQVVSVSPSQVVLDWAYQVAPANQELRERVGLRAPARAPALPERVKSAERGRPAGAPGGR